MEKTKKKLLNLLFELRRKLRQFLILIPFVWGMNLLAYSLWIKKLKFRTVMARNVMLVHYNPEIVKDVSNLIESIRGRLVKPFEKLHKFQPVVLVLPVGVTLQSGDIYSFYKSLSPDLKSEFIRAYYDERNKLGEVTV